MQSYQGKMSPFWSICAVLLLLLCWILRLHNLERFPMFIDEAIHIHDGELISNSGPLAYSEEGRQLTFWYLLLFQPARGGSVFVARAATLLVVMLGYSAAIAIGRLLVGNAGMVVIALTYLLSTYNFFFDRLALSDTLASSMVLVATYLGLRLLIRYRLRDAMLLGFALFAAILFKVAMLPYLGIPIAAAVGVPNRKLSRQQRLLWAGTAITVSSSLLASYTIVLLWRKHNPFALFSVHNPNTSMGLSVRWQTNAGYAISWLSDYFTIGVLLMLIAGVAYLIKRRHYYLPLVAFAPFAVLLLNQRQTPRYWMPSVSILLLCGGVALAALINRGPKRVPIIGAIAGTLWFAIIWFPFVRAAYDNPAQIPLPEREYREYVVADASGFGLREAAQIVREYNPDRVLGLLSNCQGLRYMAPDLPLECPKINPSGESVPELVQLVEARSGSRTYVILEDSPYVPATIQGRRLGEVERPGGRANLTVYVLEQ